MWLGNQIAKGVSRLLNQDFFHEIFNSNMIICMQIVLKGFIYHRISMKNEFVMTTAMKRIIYFLIRKNIILICTVGIGHKPYPKK